MLAHICTTGVVQGAADCATPNVQTRACCADRRDGTFSAMAARMNARVSILRALVVLPIVAVVGGCALPVGDDASSNASETALATSSTARIDLGGGGVVPIGAVRVAGSTTSLTSLATVSAAALAIDVAPGDSVGRILSATSSVSTWKLATSGGAYDLGHARVLGVTFPAASSATKDAGKITIELAPEYTRRTNAFTIAPAPATTAPSVDTFSAQLGIATSPRSATIDAVTIPIGGTGVTIGLTMNEADANAWLAWPSGELRSGQLRYAGPSGVTTVTITGASVAAKTTTGDTIRRVKVEIYCEHMKLVPDASTSK